MEKSFLCATEKTQCLTDQAKKSAGMLTNCCPLAVNRWPAGHAPKGRGGLNT
ncbi:hypothetical protein PG5_63070 [Pseudomonas sp. G5(2012)]|nr:hypothetical protein PG5_63070 [Pseudomonas sp. G5(2012)]